MKKRNIIFILSLLFSLTFIPYPSFADSGKAKDYMVKSRTLLKQKKFEQAIAAALGAEKESPKEGLYAFNTGEVIYRCYHKGMFVDKKVYMPKAIDAFSRARHKGYPKELCLNWTGRCYYQLNRFDESEEMLKQAIAIYREKKRKAEKESSSRSAIIGRELAKNLEWISKIYDYTGEWNKYHAAVTEGLELYPNNQWLPGKLKKYYRIMGHIEFGKGNYNEALTLYEKADDTYWKDICNRRQKMGTIKPIDTHVILVLYIRHITMVTKNGTEVDEGGSTDSQIEKCKMWQGIMNRWIEVTSGGKWSLAFKHLDVNSRYHEEGKYKPHSIWSLTNDDAVHRIYNEIDTFAVVSPTVSPGLGGADWYPSVPRVYKKTLRGWFQVNCTYHEINMWLHEFFHVIEYMADIKPAHGFRKEKRKHFPAWKGKKELDYYTWHFNETLPKKGWENLNYRVR